MNKSVVTLDLCEHINSGREPFSLIMSTVARLAPGEGLRVRVPFEPVPLYQEMESRGFNYIAKEQPGGEWEILFSPCD